MTMLLKSKPESNGRDSLILNADNALQPIRRTRSIQITPVRKAWDTEVPLVASILGAALRDDPVMKWVMNDPKEVWTYFYWMHQKLFAQYDEVYMSRNGKGAAMWLPPLTSDKPVNLVKLFGLSLTIFHAGGFHGLRHYLKVMKSFEKHHPTEPHYYLHAIGVRPDSRGQGVGSDLIREVLERSDREGVRVYTENTCEESLPFLKRHGFKVTGVEILPDGGPKVWFMERLPRRH